MKYWTLKWCVYFWFLTDVDKLNQQVCLEILFEFFLDFDLQVKTLER